MLLHNLQKEKLIHPPEWLIDNTQYLAIMGSQAYGINNADSDYDLVGFTIPTKEIIFPHQYGEILGFGRQKKRFDQFLASHVEFNKKQYDITVFSIVRVFHLMMEGNPNSLEILFAPRDCILHSTPIGEHIRENRHLFLSKVCWPRLKGYSFSQLNKAKSQQRVGKRKEGVEQYGYDLKFASHTVRLLDYCEQIFTLKDLDLRKPKEMLKSIRRGEWTLKQVEDYFAAKELELEKLYHSSDLPYSSREGEIRKLLLECLEMHYGDLSNTYKEPDQFETALRKIKEICSILP